MSTPSESSPWSKLKILPIVFVLALFAMLWWRSGSESTSTPPEKVVEVQRLSESDEHTTTLSGPIFGTRYIVKVNEKLDDISRGGLQSKIERHLSQIDEAMSTYKATSEVSRFNALAMGQSVTVSQATAEVLEVALHIGQQSEGAFDVTVGPLVDAWGFGPKGGGKAPDEATLAKLRESVGASRVLQIDEDTRTLVKKVAGAQLDLSAVAKGYAVDSLMKLLTDREYAGVLVEIGGELRVSGQRGDGKAWKLGVQNPEGGGAYEVIDAEQGALATSGDYRNFRVYEGKRVSHTIDPRTGRPVTHNLASVSVLADNCAAADAWATALTVLGPEQGMKLAEEERLAVMMLVRQDKGFERLTTKLWPTHGQRAHEDSGTAGK
ncbi:MAG TPA: hypothetical protein DCQ06_01505 [Myxococcales bacterium]|nr:hypothetical protein [Myxococcales bacterium]HAN30249.1 hypothetical protein [Myxococcales bacterium]